MRNYIFYPKNKIGPMIETNSSTENDGKWIPKVLIPKVALNSIKTYRNNIVYEIVFFSSFPVPLLELI